MKDKKGLLKEFLILLDGGKPLEAINFFFEKGINYGFSADEVQEMGIKVHTLIYSVLIGSFGNLLTEEQMNDFVSSMQAAGSDQQDQLEVFSSILVNNGIENPIEFIFGQTAVLMYFHLKLLAVPKNEYTQTEINLKNNLNNGNAKGLTAFLTEDLKQLI
jgi:hypothetical protein